MNDQFKNNPDQADEFARKLHDIAKDTNANAQFMADLENKLKATHQPKTNWSMPAFKKITPALGWTVFVIVFGFALSWSIRNLIPAHQPGANTTPNQFVCPVTLPNGNLPPDALNADYFGNGQLWTNVSPNGKLYYSLADKMPDGSFEEKWGFWRGTHGTLTVEGHRLDADAPPLRPDYPEGYPYSYGDTGLQVLGLIFPTTGCWEVTGHVGDVSLTFVTEVVFGEATPTPDVAVIATTTTPIATAVANNNGYDFRGTKLYLNAPLPTAAEANVYSAKKEQPATIEFAKTLAAQFGIQGNIYAISENAPGVTGYLVTDGKQRLYVHSALNFDYYAEYSLNTFLSGGKNISKEQAAVAIDTFMKSHGMNFNYQVENAYQMFGVFYVIPLTPDLLPIRYDYNLPSRFEFTVDDIGRILLVSSYLVDSDLIGVYGIRSAEEAFQQLLGTSNSIQNGVLEIMHGGGTLNESFWQRSYPDNQTVTIYGQPTSYPSVEAGASRFMSIGQYTATGNTNGIENVDSSNTISASGQFTTENGTRIFNIDTWKTLDSQETSISGTFRREGNQVILTSNDGSGKGYVIADAPTDVPLDALPDGQLNVNGFLIHGNFDWTSIQYFPANSGGGGGGGGGGTGFYKLNLSGTPVPLPTTTFTPTINSSTGQYKVKAGDTLSSIAYTFGISVNELMNANNITSPGLIQIDQQLIIPGAQTNQPAIGQHIEGLRGILNVTIYKKPDGSQRYEFIFQADAKNGVFPFMVLEGIDSQSLAQYHNLPIDIWGTVDRFDNNNAIIKVDHFQAPYPNLQFQLLRGTQKTGDIQGRPVVFFTTEEGKTYIQLTSNGDINSPVDNIDGISIDMQALIIPNETLGGYPALRAMSFSEKNSTNPATITVAKPSVIDEPPPSPSLTIEKVELVYYTPDPRNTAQNPTTDPTYIQPAWRFYGHYSNGAEFEILVQALKLEYLLPELAPYTPPG